MRRPARRDAGEGEGGPPDVERGIELLSSKAANRGLGNAILGELYLEGKLVGPDPQRHRADGALCGERLRAAPESSPAFWSTTA